MSIKTFDNVHEFGRAIQESPLHQLRYVGTSDNGVFEFDTDTDTDSNVNIGRFKLPVGYVQQKPYLNGILDENGISVFNGKMIWIDGDDMNGLINCKGMFAQMNVQTVGYGIKFDDVDVDASFMFNESNFDSDRLTKIIGGRLHAKGMFRGCKNREVVGFVSVKFHDVTRLVADSSISELTFYNCDLACDETEFETNTKSCIYKNGHLETINFKGCTDKFVRAMIEHINKYGEDDDNIVINIKD